MLVTDARSANAGYIYAVVVSMLFLLFIEDIDMTGQDCLPAQFHSCWRIITYPVSFMLERYHIPIIHTSYKPHTKYHLRKAQPLILVINISFNACTKPQSTFMQAKPETKYNSY